MKPIILTTKNNVLKFKLPFSVLCKLRDDDIDFINGNAWKHIENNVELIYPILRRGISYAEKRTIEEEEIVEIVDDLMETIGFEGVYDSIMRAISIKGAYVTDDEEASEVEEIEEKKEKKN